MDLRPGRLLCLQYLRFLAPRTINGIPGPPKYVKQWPFRLFLVVWGYYFTYFCRPGRCLEPEASNIVYLDPLGIILAVIMSLVLVAVDVFHGDGSDDD